MLLVVLWRLRYKLSLRDLAEMFRTRGLVFTHEMVRDGGALRATRRRPSRVSGVGVRLDETYIRVGGRSCLLVSGDRSGWQPAEHYGEPEA